MAIPTTVPNFVPSSPDKVDLERLKRDIPKFLDNSRIITPEQCEWWQIWFSNAPKVYGPGPPKPDRWLLDELKEKKISCSTTSVSHHENREEEELNEIPIGVPEDIAKIVEVQCREIPEVYIKILYIV